MDEFFEGVASKSCNLVSTGIFFQNKVDYATWFGWRYDFIHGIQMLPVTPAVLMIRTPKFCQQERHLLGPVFRGTMPKSEQQIPLPAPDPLVSNSSVTSTSLLQKFEKLGPVFLKLMILYP